MLQIVANKPHADTVAICFTLPRALLALIERRAASELTNKSDIVRRAMLNYLSPEERAQIRSIVTGHSGRVAVVNGSHNKISLGEAAASGRGKSKAKK